MKRLSLLCLAALVLATAPGCHLFRKKHPKPKEVSTIGTDTELEFKHRWLDRRTAELVGKGTNAQAARAQAEEEFRQRFSYTQAVNKP